MNNLTTATTTTTKAVVQKTVKVTNQDKERKRTSEMIEIETESVTVSKPIKEVIFNFRLHFAVYINNIL